MSKKYLEINSSWRNRNQYPNPAEFELGTNSTIETTAENAKDIVINSYPIKYFETLDYNLTPCVGMGTNTEITLIPLGIPLSDINNYYVGYWLFDNEPPAYTTTHFRIITKYDGITHTITIDTPLRSGWADASLPVSDIFYLQSANGLVSPTTGDPLGLLTIPNGLPNTGSYINYYAEGWRSSILNTKITAYEGSLKIASLQDHQGTLQVTMCAAFGIPFGSQTTILLIGISGPALSNIDGYYVGDWIVDWEPPDYVNIHIHRITNYVGATQIATVDPPLRAGWVQPTFLGPPYDYFTINATREIFYNLLRPERPIFRNNSVLFSGTCVYLGKTYKYIQLSTNMTNMTNMTNTSSASNFFILNKNLYVSGVTPNYARIIYYFPITPAELAPIPNNICLIKETNINFSLGNYIDILQFTRDNYTPINYSGSLFNERCCFDITLISLTIPNVSLSTTDIGGYVVNVPYCYIEFESINNRNLNLINSNNPNSTHALFFVSLDDYPSTFDSPFVRVNGNYPSQTIKFNPLDSFKFRIVLPSGQTLTMTENDDMSPTFPNPNMQISALFSIEKIELNRSKLMKSLKENSRLLEINSTYRNRRDFPNPANFDIAINGSFLTTDINSAIAPISEGFPVSLFDCFGGVRPNLYPPIFSDFALIGGNYTAQAVICDWCTSPNVNILSDRFYFELPPPFPGGIFVESYVRDIVAIDKDPSTDSGYFYVAFLAKPDPAFPSWWNQSPTLEIALPGYIDSSHIQINDPNNWEDNALVNYYVEPFILYPYTLFAMDTTQIIQPANKIISYDSISKIATLENLIPNWLNPYIPPTMGSLLLCVGFGTTQDITLISLSLPLSDVVGAYVGTTLIDCEYPYSPDLFHFTTIIAYSGMGHVATVNPPLRTGWVQSGSYNPDLFIVDPPIRNNFGFQNYLIVKKPFVNKGYITGASSTTAVLSNGGNIPNEYVGMYFICFEYLKSFMTGVKINAYDNTTKTITFSPAISVDLNPYSMNFLEVSGILYQNGYAICQYSYDNYHPLVISENVTERSMCCYEISLISLVLPNVPLKTYGIGGYVINLPHIYVEFYNKNDSFLHSFYSNNPYVSKSLFLVSLVDYPKKTESPFVRINNINIQQIIKIKLGDTLHFTIRLPNGGIFESVTSDVVPHPFSWSWDVLQDNENYPTWSIAPPDSRYQINALFNVKRIN